MSAFRAGFAALVGRPNVGKSTLLNKLVGQKLSIVTPRPQTTRHRIIGLVNLPEAQIAFVDTPGLHEGGKRALNVALNRTAASALNDADLVVLVVEALRWFLRNGGSILVMAGDGSHSATGGETLIISTPFACALHLASCPTSFQYHITTPTHPRLFHSWSC